MSKHKQNMTLKNFILDMCQCFDAGDVELGIELKVEQDGNILYITDSEGNKFRVTVELDKWVA